MSADTRAKIVANRLSAMKSKDSVTKSCLDYIYGEIQRKEKDANWKGEESVISVIKTYVSSLKDFISQHPQASIADGYRSEIKILGDYLPQIVSEDIVREFIIEFIASNGTNKGDVMKGLKSKFGSTVDMKAATRIFGELSAS